MPTPIDLRHHLDLATAYIEMQLHRAAVEECDAIIRELERQGAPADAFSEARGLREKAINADPSAGIRSPPGEGPSN